MTKGEKKKKKKNQGTEKCFARKDEWKTQGKMVFLRIAFIIIIIIIIII